MRPYLQGPLRRSFDLWVEATVARYMPPLSFREVRKGVQALSSLYVERRAQLVNSRATLDGRGKRAALATYYAPLHFLIAWHALEQLLPRRLAPPRRIWDLGCGTGAAGAAVARTFEPVPPVIGIDRSATATAEARITYRRFDTAARIRRGRLPAALPSPRTGELWLLSFTLNELDVAAREAVLAALQKALRSGTSVLILEARARAVAPWWPAWCDALAPLAVEAHLKRRSLARPEWIGRLDRATGLDHRILGSRVLAGPLLDEEGGDTFPADAGRREREAQLSPTA